MSTMANAAVAAVGGGNPDNVSKFLEALQSDLKVLASETKKKYPQIKEVGSCDNLTFMFVH